MLRLTTIILLITFSLQAQLPDNYFGNVTDYEINLDSYDKDKDANALVLYERGDNYFKMVNGRVRLIKEYHTKIKILKEEGFDQATIEIPFYNGDNTSEKISGIKAVTHNGTNQFNVLPKEIFETDRSEHVKIIKFTFPKVEVGSILEYTYTNTSPYMYSLTGWEFQSYIPKLYTEFNATIPGNWVYNRTLIGNIPLDINDSKLKKQCFHVDGYAKSADCEVLKYAMKNVPAFEPEEEFMLAESNYISRLEFELSQFNRTNGTTDRYTKSWEDVDREFRADKDIGRQLTKKGFFEKNVPESLLTEGDKLTRAKNIYRFVRDYYTWTGEYGIFGKARVKEAFDEAKGNVSEINMSLINLLNAADIETNLMLISTRQEGLPKKTHPVMNDFNYVLAKTNIDGKDYLLDATDKYVPFGILPFRALNYYGRVMDFRNDSYWFDIVANTDNLLQVRAQIELKPEGETSKGALDVTSIGYNGIETKKNIQSMPEREYLDKMEERIAGDFKITSYEANTELSEEGRISERFYLEMDSGLDGNRIYFNPFLISFFDSNPFKLDSRNYPIDFGYTRYYKYQINIILPEGYEVVDVPEKKVATLGDNLAILKFFDMQNTGSVMISFELKLNKTYYSAEDYEALKMLFRDAVELQNNALIVLQKASTGKG